MNTTISITPTPQLVSLLEKLRETPALAVRAVVNGMNAAGTAALGNAVKNRFTGAGPFPVSQHRLGVRTQLLRKSLRFTPAEVDAAKGRVVQRFGSNIVYFAIHEFGFTGPVSVKGHRRRNAIRASSGGSAAQGSSKGRIRVKKGNEFSNVKPHTRNLAIAARAPLGTELQSDRTRQLYMTEIGRALQRELNGNGGLA